MRLFPGLAVTTKTTKTNIDAYQVLRNGDYFGTFHRLVMATNENDYVIAIGFDRGRLVHCDHDWTTNAHIRICNNDRWCEFHTGPASIEMPHGVIWKNLMFGVIPETLRSGKLKPRWQL